MGIVYQETLMEVRIICFTAYACFSSPNSPQVGSTSSPGNCKRTSLGRRSRRLIWPGVVLARRKVELWSLAVWWFVYGSPRRHRDGLKDLKTDSLQDLLLERSNVTDAELRPAPPAWSPDTRSISARESSTRLSVSRTFGRARASGMEQY